MLFGPHHFLYSFCQQEPSHVGFLLPERRMFHQVAEIIIENCRNANRQITHFIVFTSQRTRPQKENFSGKITKNPEKSLSNYFSAPIVAWRFDEKPDGSWGAAGQNNTEDGDLRYLTGLAIGGAVVFCGLSRSATDRVGIVDRSAQRRTFRRHWVG